MRGARFWLTAGAMGMGLVVLGCPTLPPEMAKIPAGPFQMGTDEPPRVEGDAFALLTPLFAAESPRHRRTLPAYALDRFEVTHTQYARFTAANHRPPPDWQDGTLPAGREEYPVVNVSWHDASAFCRWAGKRLPTEAEWEKAASGPEGLEYPWGDTFESDRLAGDGEVHPVGSFEAGTSPYGLYDMAGNVWEWTTDWYQPYPGGSDALAPPPEADKAESQRTDAFGQRHKVVRGGAYAPMGGHYITFIYRTSFRFYFAPDRQFVDVGFRCAKTL